MKRLPLAALLALFFLSGGTELFAQIAKPDQTAPATTAEEPIVEIFELSDDDVLPSYDAEAFARLVVYPELARKNGLEGTVAVKFIVEPDGRTSRIEIVKSDDSVFDQSALDAVRQTRFNPATKDGRPVRVAMVMPIRYTLQ
jgi:TonB family protein